MRYNEYSDIPVGQSFSLHRPDGSRVARMVRLRDAAAISFIDLALMEDLCFALADRDSWRTQVFATIETRQFPEFVLYHFYAQGFYAEVSK